MKQMLIDIKIKLDGIDENGQDKFKYGINKWFNYKGLTWVRDQKEDYI